MSNENGMIYKYSKENFDKLVEALEFYSEDINWRCPNGAIDFIATKEMDRYLYKGQILCGGKIARKALAEVEKLKQS